MSGGLVLLSNPGSIPLETPVSALSSGSGAGTKIGGRISSGFMSLSNPGCLLF